MPRLPAFLTHLHIRALGPVASVPATEALRATLGAFLGLAIAALVAISTSLLGPTAFMGVCGANSTYALARNFRHRVTLALGSAIAVGMFIAGQLLVEHVFNYKTTVGILVNLVCGGYFLVLMVRTRGTP